MSPLGMSPPGTGLLGVGPPTTSPPATRPPGIGPPGMSTPRMSTPTEDEHACTPGRWTLRRCAPRNPVRRPPRRRLRCVSRS
eukprot:3500220-Prymnesium_polylepis.1